MIQEFKTFIARGNVIDLAVGIIIGAAFTAIVNSLVVDLINPILGLLTGGIDFTNKYVVLSGTVPQGASLAAARDSGAAIYAYGSFLMAVLFMATLDNQIVSTALPTIVGEFGQLERFGWIGSSYLLASSAVMPLLTRMATPPRVCPTRSASPPASM